MQSCASDLQLPLPTVYPADLAELCSSGSREYLGYAEQVPTPAVRRLEASDLAEHVRMRQALWPDAEVTEMAREAEAMLADPDLVVFGAQRAGGGLCGFVEAGVRAFADGVDESPCAFVEGWWVDPDQRQRGIGRALIAAVEDWARTRGFRELGSDALLENTISHRAHAALGFEERERVVYFRKFLEPGATSGR